MCMYSCTYKKAKTTKKYLIINLEFFAEIFFSLCIFMIKTHHIPKTKKLVAYDEIIRMDWICAAVVF